MITGQRAQQIAYTLEDTFERIAFFLHFLAVDEMQFVLAARIQYVSESQLYLFEIDVLRDGRILLLNNGRPVDAFGDPEAQRIEQFVSEHIDLFMYAVTEAQNDFVYTDHGEAVAA